MIGHWRKINIDEYILNLADFYLDCSKVHFRTANTVETLNQEEKKYLNDNINLEKIVGEDKKFILNKVLGDKSKINFARHLLTSVNIDLVVNSIDETNKSTFQLLIENAEPTPNYFYYYTMPWLYKRGYRNSKIDEAFLVDFYKNKIKSEKHFELWCFARICYKLNNYDKIEKAFSKDKVILSIISFKTGKPVGFNYPNLLGVANNAIQHYREQGDLLLDAMKKYDVYNDIVARDKKGTFKLKEQDFNKFKPIQDTNFNELVYEIFPELEQTKSAISS